MTTKKKKKPGKIVIDKERCKGCHLCIDVCPNLRIEVEKALNKKGYFPAHFRDQKKEDDKDCTACAQCALVCPEVAIEVYRAK